MQASVRERAARLARHVAQVAEAGAHPAHGTDTPQVLRVLVVGVGPLRSIRVVSTSLRQPRTRRAPGMLPGAADTHHWLPELSVHAPRQSLGTPLRNNARLHPSVDVILKMGLSKWRTENDNI